MRAFFSSSFFCARLCASLLAYRVKSHRAKGKRLTTYDVAALRFIEPGEPEKPDTPDPSASLDALEPAGDVSDLLELPTELAADASGVVMTGSAELEIVRSNGDAGQPLDPEQLDLF